MLKKIFCVSFFLLLIFVPKFVLSEGNHIVINSLRLSGATATDEYIEIYNPTSETVLLTGWRLAKKSASGASYNLLSSFPETELAPLEFLVIAHRDFQGEADLRYSTSNSISSDNSIVLYSDAGNTAVDIVGWGDALTYENQAIPNPGSGEILKRKINGVDSDNNFFDFSLPETVKTEDVIEPAGDQSGKIIITELMPNPKGADSEGEWIEIYNTEIYPVQLPGFCLQDKIGAVKKFCFSEGVLTPGGYRTVYSKESKISLSNSGDVVEIYNEGKLISTTGNSYGDADEGISYGLFGNVWGWTSLPTPGGKNSLKSPPQTVEKSKKTKKTSSKTPKATVKGSVFNDSMLDEGRRKVSFGERIIGIGLIVAALVLGLVYSVYTNKEKLIALYNKKRKRNQGVGSKDSSREPRG